MKIRIIRFGIVGIILIASMIILPEKLVMFSLNSTEISPEGSVFTAVGRDKRDSKNSICTINNKNSIIKDHTENVRGLNSDIQVQNISGNKNRNYYANSHIPLNIANSVNDVGILVDNNIDILDEWKSYDIIDVCIDKKYLYKLRKVGNENIVNKYEFISEKLNKSIELNNIKKVSKLCAYNELIYVFSEKTGKVYCINSEGNVRYTSKIEIFNYTVKSIVADDKQVFLTLESNSMKVAKLIIFSKDLKNTREKIK